ncbi:MAG: 4Fe-4S binding protein [Bacillota bacterium]
MSDQKLAYNQHYVCTEQEALDLLSTRDRFWLAECGCRKDSCRRSGKEVCLWFINETHFPSREINHTEALAVHNYAAEKNLVYRPFRSQSDPKVIEGICHCCDCCCSYFRGEEPSDKGMYVEQTDHGSCSQCGLCVPRCYFGARSMVAGKLQVDTEKCYGCGLCVKACLTGCISMVARRE